MLEEKTRAALQVQLEADLARLEDILAELSRNHRESLSEASGEHVYRDHMADQGTATFERDMDLTIEENERAALEEVRAALGRIEAGVYGVCSRCSAEIPAARLEAMPTATLCITCKAAEESH